MSRAGASSSGMAGAAGTLPPAKRCDRMSNDPHSQEDAFGLPPRPPSRRYYFDIHDGESLTRDDTGLELDGLPAAQDEAVRALAEIVKDTLPDGARRDFVVEVRDETGRGVLRAALSFAVESL